MKQRERQNWKFGYNFAQNILIYIFTARILRMTERNVFILSTMMGGTSIWLMGGGWGYPILPLDGGYPILPPSRRQSSKVNTCYTAGGMPLAFTQEDFFVFLRLFNALPLNVTCDMKTVSSRERNDRQYGILPTFYDNSSGYDMSDVVQWDTYPYDE